MSREMETLADIIPVNAEKCGARTAVQWLEDRRLHSVDYRSLGRLVSNFRDELIARGVRPGDRIGSIGVPLKGTRINRRDVPARGVDVDVKMDIEEKYRSLEKAEKSLKRGIQLSKQLLTFAVVPLLHFFFISSRFFLATLTPFR